MFNMETLALISGDRDTSSMMVVSSTKDANPFTKMLANVVKDSTILQNHEVVIENPAKGLDTAKAINEVAGNPVSTSLDTTAIANNVTSSAPPSPDEDSETATSTVSTTTSAADSSSVAKLLSKRDKDGLQMVYADTNGNKSDTVKVFIPAENNQTASESEATNKDNFDFTQSNNGSNTTVDTSQLTITPTIIKPGNEKKGFVLRKDTIATASDSAAIGKTAPEQVFYIGPKDKEKKETTEKT